MAEATPPLTPSRPALAGSTASANPPVSTGSPSPAGPSAPADSNLAMRRPGVGRGYWQLTATMTSSSRKVFPSLMLTLWRMQRFWAIFKFGSVVGYRCLDGNNQTVWKLHSLALDSRVQFDPRSTSDGSNMVSSDPCPAPQPSVSDRGAPRITHVNQRRQ